MTTRSSPIQALKAQAGRIARAVKQRGLDTCKFAVVMDDKTFVIEVSGLLAMSEHDLAKYVLDRMQEL